jgi:hypothetical protein
MKKLTAVLTFSLTLAGCIRPQNYHTGASSALAIHFPGPKPKEIPYFEEATAYEAYIELDASGHFFDRTQVDRAVALIQSLKHPAGGGDQAVSMFLFVHGWKNNASEESGNVWGFRWMLDHYAARLPMPVVGVYIAWPGDVTRVGKFFSFWNRQSVANSVGAGDLDEALQRLLLATKEDGDKSRASNAVMIGHSFGGLVLERAAIRLINDQLAGVPNGGTIAPLADLTLLLNEAGPASQAHQFLKDLLNDHVHYEDSARKPYPLMVSMTSDGDAATKIAFPGGEFVSPDRPKTETLTGDVFGQSDTLPYNLLSPANMVALRSHAISPIPLANFCDGIPVTVHGQRYCVAKILPQPANTTPYWIMALPQIFVPDHSSVFRAEMVALIDAFLLESQVQLQAPSSPPPGPSNNRRGPAPKAVPLPPSPPPAAAAPAPPPPSPSERPVLRKVQ